MPKDEETFSLEYVTALRREGDALKQHSADLEAKLLTASDVIARKRNDAAEALADDERRAKRDARADRQMAEDEARALRERRELVRNGTPEQYAAHKAEMLATARKTMRGKPEQSEPINARDLTPNEYAAQKAAYLRNARR
ncbi:hypothetical protein [Paraburkholderia sp. GAS348]|uniref:hypothetical protein n=1 Tax=Paraburkholderia sp. GAS348 TaxID=3035132 RepID=UPI003D2185DD